MLLKPHTRPARSQQELRKNTPKVVQDAQLCKRCKTCPYQVCRRREAQRSEHDNAGGFGQSACLVCNGMLMLLLDC